MWIASYLTGIWGVTPHPNASITQTDKTTLDNQIHYEIKPVQKSKDRRYVTRQRNNFVRISGNAGWVWGGRKGENGDAQRIFLLEGWGPYRFAYYSQRRRYA